MSYATFPSAGVFISVLKALFLFFSERGEEYIRLGYFSSASSQPLCPPQVRIQTLPLFMIESHLGIIHGDLNCCNTTLYGTIFNFYVPFVVSNLHVYKHLKIYGLIHRKNYSHQMEI